MNFTREDILKIQNALLQLGRKDSEFKDANTPLNSDDYIAILQDGINKKVSINNLLSTLGLLKKDDFINVSDRYDEYYIQLSEAITIIANNKRKKGLVVTFQDLQGDWKIYQFDGELNNFSNTDYWKDLFDFKYPIVNSVLPDEEDLTLTLPNEDNNSFIKLKDKEYDTTNFSGIGTKIIRKNIIEITQDDGTIKRINYLSPDVFNSENTIYEIKYEFDLNGQTINIPNNCVLKFNGGNICNGTITYNNTYIENFNKSYSNVVVTGTVANPVAFSDWFGTKKDGVNDDSTALQNFFNCGVNKLIVTQGAYKINKGLSLPANSNIDFSFAVLYPASGVTCLGYHGYSNGLHTTDTVLKNFIIESNGKDNIIGLQIGRGVYFNYVYNFDIRVYGKESIGIVETSNFNTILRDGRIIGRIEGYQENSIGIKFTTGTDDLFNNQVTNLLTDSVLIQGFDNGVLLDYGSTSHDTIQFNNIGFSNCNYGYYFKSGYTNVTIINQRIENSNLLFKVQQCRGLAVRDLYVLDSGFLELTKGAVDASGYIYCIRIGTGTDEKRFLKIDGGTLAWNVGAFDNWGYGLNDEIAENSIICNGIRYSNINDALNRIGTVYKKDNLFVGKINSTLDKPLRYVEDINKKVLYNKDYTTLSVDQNVDTYGIQGNIGLVEGGYDGQILKIISGDGLQHSITLNNIYYGISKNDHLTIQKVNGEWVLYSDSSVKLTHNYLPDGVSIGTMIVFYEENSGQYEILMKISEDKWLDSNGYTFGLKYGVTDKRPTELTETDKGKSYFDTDLGRQVIWDGYKWVYPNGILSSTKFSGTFSQKPTSEQNIPVGFAYYCTDKQTSEGATNGIMIYYKGNNIWVDALGREVN